MNGSVLPGKRVRPSHQFCLKCTPAGDLIINLKLRKGFFNAIQKKLYNFKFLCFYFFAIFTFSFFHFFHLLFISFVIKLVGG